LYFPEEQPKQLDEVETLRILDQVKEMVANANIHIFQSNKEFVSSFYRAWRRSGATTVQFQLHNK
jgi:hypothetical protein